MSLDALKPTPSMDTVRFESEPPGAEAKTSTDKPAARLARSRCRSMRPVTVTFYAQRLSAGDGKASSRFQRTAPDAIAAQSGHGRTDSRHRRRPSRPRSRRAKKPAACQAEAAQDPAQRQAPAAGATHRRSSAAPAPWPSNPPPAAPKSHAFDAIARRHHSRRLIARVSRGRAAMAIVEPQFLYRPHGNDGNGDGKSTLDIDRAGTPAARAGRSVCSAPSPIYASQ